MTRLAGRDLTTVDCDRGNPHWFFSFDHMRQDATLSYELSDKGPSLRVPGVPTGINKSYFHLIIRTPSKILIRSHAKLVNNKTGKAQKARASSPLKM